MDSTKQLKLLPRIHSSVDITFFDVSIRAPFNKQKALVPQGISQVDLQLSLLIVVVTQRLYTIYLPYSHALVAKSRNVSVQSGLLISTDMKN
ncbi:hypothetical protein T10_11867 [Trichinella papuae]|uniref:Uncharacterized protein n=1 Tax=Trichinella papuae TaxID=268474 RepID=A0A0V1M3H3_9BILA|nr:hypothetical protein T10_11867 [Trichinella papuae]